MPLTVKIGAAMAATVAASLLAISALAPFGGPAVPASPTGPTVNRAVKADRLDAGRRLSDRRLACLAQDWLQLSSDCAELFTREAQRPDRQRTTTIVLRERGGSVVIPVPRPESE